MPVAPIHRFTYRAFISYSHRDKSWAAWLHHALETYRVPRRLVGTRTAHGIVPRRLHPIFRDREELASATELGRKVNEALAQSENLVVICSPASASSRWVNEEVLAYKRLGRGERIFCLIVAGEPGASNEPDREAEECFCPGLRFRLDAEGQATDERIEPIAADARPGNDGKANAKLKLIAGMLNVGFDTLKQREQQRRIRRMAMVTALALSVMTVTSLLAVYAFFSRQEVIATERQAVAGRQAAEHRQKQAEDLVGFMLGDLNDKLNAVGRLDIMQAVDDKAMTYFATLPAADATDDTLAMRVTALQKIGGVRRDQGDTPAALKAYQAAASLAAALVQRAPRDPARRARYADSLKALGEAYWYQGDQDRALANFRAADAALQEALAIRPGDIHFLASLAYIQTNTARFLEARGELDDAKRYYESVLKIFRGLQTRQPTNTSWQAEVGYAHNNLGTLALRQGRLGDAVAAFRDDQQIKAAIVAGAHDNRQAQEDLLVSNAILGRTLALCGDLAGALRYTQAAVDSAKRLVAYDTANVYWQEFLGLYSQQLGGLLRQRGRIAEATSADRKAIRILKGLAAKDPTYADYEQELAQGRLEWAQLQLLQGKEQQAAQTANSSLVSLQALQVKTPGDESLVLLVAKAHILLGRTVTLQHDLDASRRHWLQARDALAPMARSGSDPRQLAAYAEALLRLGDVDQAGPFLARLAAMGYSEPDFVALVSGAKLEYPVNAAVMQRIAGPQENVDARP